MTATKPPALAKCPRCRGSGWVNVCRAWVSCYQCGGAGRVARKAKVRR